MLKSLFVLGLLNALITPAAKASATPDQFSFRVQASIGRCVPRDGVKPEDGLRCENPRQDRDETVDLVLDKCDGKNIFGKNCQGTWEEFLSVDQQKYRFRVIIGRFADAPFEYQISANVCPEPVGLGECSFTTLYLPKAELPSLHLIAPWVKTGSGPSAVWYNPQLLLNRTPFPGQR